MFRIPDSVPSNLYHTKDVIMIALYFQLYPVISFVVEPCDNSLDIVYICSAEAFLTE